jgi:hypothetical protein
MAEGGESDPAVLAALADYRLRATPYFTRSLSEKCCSDS